MRKQSVTFLGIMLLIGASFLVMAGTLTIRMSYRDPDGCGGTVPAVASASNDCSTPALVTVTVTMSKCRSYSPSGSIEGASKDSFQARSEQIITFHADCSGAVKVAACPATPTPQPGSPTATPTPTPEPAACLPPGTSCSNNGECCSRSCDAGLGGRGCGCLPYGAACGANWECCSYFICDKETLTCQSYRAPTPQPATPPAATPTAATPPKATPLMTGGVPAVPTLAPEQVHPPTPAPTAAPTCGAKFAACTTNAQCCSNYCSGGIECY